MNSISRFGLGAAFVLGVTVWLQPSAAARPVTVSTVVPAKTPPVRTMHTAMPGIMARLVGSRHLTRRQLERLRKTLVRAGKLRPRGKKYLVPLKRMRPAMQQAPAVRDPVRQKRVAGVNAGNAVSRGFTTPATGFDGLGTSSGDTVNCAPPDTDAAVGFNDVVEIVNCAGAQRESDFAVFDKTGKRLAGPIDLSTLWANSAGICQTGGNGDGVVLYDQLADRWVLSQFASPGGGTTMTDECVAVSQSSDPTGAYYVYDFQIDPFNFVDYPKLGVWPDAYYASFNDFISNNFDYVNFVAFERSAMLAGRAATEVVINGPPYAASSFDYSDLPASVDGYAPPPAGAPGIFLNYVSPASWDTTFYALEMWQMHVDWLNPANSTLIGPTEIDVAPFLDGSLIGSATPGGVPEPGGNQLDALGDRLMFRLAYRNFGSHQALVANHTVASVTGSASSPLGVRWYELDAPVSATSASAWSVAQQSTYAPADGTTRWMASIAMDHVGDIALGFSTSSPHDDPAIAYTGHTAAATPGSMNEPETVLQAGGGYQNKGLVRWGDYSSMVLDPSDDCTFWYAQEYEAATGSYNWSTHIGALKFANCTALPTGTLAGTVTDASSGAPLQGAEVSLPGGFEAVTDANGRYASTVAAGSYTAQAADFRYEAGSASVSISAGQTATQDFALTSAPTAKVSGTVTDGGIKAGSHGWGLYAKVKVITPQWGEVADVWTDPATGAYSIALPQGADYTLQISAYFGGYKADIANVSNLSADTTRNVSLPVDSNCDALGYGAPFEEKFNEAKFPPTGWRVRTGFGATWGADQNLNKPGNWTGGSGDAASVDEYAYCQASTICNNTFDTALVSPPISVSSLGGAHILHYRANYQEEGPDDTLDLDISTDGGTTWTNLSRWQKSHGALYALPGEGDTVDLASYLPSSGDFQLRWRYYNLVDWAGWYAQVDDVAIGTCSVKPGGLIVGQVTRAATGKGVAGAAVSDALGHSTLTHATPTDPNLADIYALFTSSGPQVLAAVAGTASVASVLTQVASDQAVRQDMAFGNADLAVPAVAGTSLQTGATGQVATIIVSNNGPDPAIGAQLSTTASYQLKNFTATASAGSCAANADNGVDCDLGDIAVGSSVTVTLTATGAAAGQAGIAATVLEAENDPVSTNNAASIQVTVTPAPTSGSHGAGGLGELDLMALFLALGVAWLRRVVPFASVKYRE